MRKIIFPILLLLTLTLLGQSNNSTKIELKVTDIKCIKTEYVVELEDSNKNKYVILSMKTDSKEESEKILINKKYNFYLVDFIEKNFHISNAPIVLKVYNKVIWKEADNFRVYSTINLKGLYYLNEDN